MPAVFSASPPPPSAASDAASDQAARAQRTANLTRAVAVGSLLALIVLGLAWELWLAPTGRGTLALKVLPLAVPLVGLLKRRMYTYRWVSLMVWIYFTEGVVRAVGDRGISAWLAGIEIVLCLLLFAACAAHVRLRLHNAASAAATSTAAAPASASDHAASASVR